MRRGGRVAHVPSPVEGQATQEDREAVLCWVWVVCGRLGPAFFPGGGAGRGLVLGSWVGTLPRDSPHRAVLLAIRKLLRTSVAAAIPRPSLSFRIIPRLRDRLRFMMSATRWRLPR